MSNSRATPAVQSKLNRQGLDFAFPVSQEEQDEQEQETPQKYIESKCIADLEFGTLTYLQL